MRAPRGRVWTAGQVTDCPPHYRSTSNHTVFLLNYWRWPPAPLSLSALSSDKFRLAPHRSFPGDTRREFWLFSGFPQTQPTQICIIIRQVWRGSIYTAQTCCPSPDIPHNSVLIGLGNNVNHSLDRPRPLRQATGQAWGRPHPARPPHLTRPFTYHNASDKG